ncbi:MAG: hypothetical protein ABSG93_07500 [Solirubrobacteraceae bacterium]|jgi:hypothetical protein
MLPIDVECTPLVCDAVVDPICAMLGTLEPDAGIAELELELEPELVV